MNKLITIILAILLVAPSLTFAGADAYLGDTAIYTGDPGVVKPNILLIIDNSKATLNKAAGFEYTFDADNPYPNPATGLQGSPWNIYEGDNQGNFTSLLMTNSSVVFSGDDPVNFNNLANFSGCPAVVARDLIQFGTYAADGTAARPVIKANQNKCVTAPKGAVYALNNFIYYTKTPPPTPVVVVDGAYYSLLAEHVATEDTKPGSGADWQNYWGLLADYEGNADAWEIATNYTLADDALNQRAIMYHAIEQVLKSTYHLANFGAMIYGGNNKGGKIVYDITNFGTDSTDANNNGIPDVLEPFLAALPGPGINDGPAAITAGPQRPQSEALYDAGAYLGATWTPISETKKIPTAVSIDCNTHVIFLTNGLSNSEGDPKLGTNIGNADGGVSITYQGTTYPDVANEGVYGLGTHYLDDVAFKLQREYDITTHMILAFQKIDGLIVRAAVHGKGEFHNVFNANQLVSALQGLIFRTVLEENTSFVAPVVPASTTNRTMSSDRVYLGLFKPQQGKPWLGNLKKYKINKNNELVDINDKPATDANGDFITATNSFWGTNSSGQIMTISNKDNNWSAVRAFSEGDGGLIDAGGVGGTMLARLLSNEERKVITYLGVSTDLNDASNKVTKTNLTAGVTGIANDGLRNDLVDYLLGNIDLFDHDDDDVFSEKRPWVLGDILHSRPVVFHYKGFAPAKENSCYANDSAGNRTYIFVGSNEGMMHAIRDCDGSEAWAFIPPNLLNKLTHLTDPFHNYYVDASPTLYVHDHNNNGIIESGDKVIMIFGQGRGGGSNRLLSSESRGAYTAIDITNPEAPVFLWQISNQTTGFTEMGETWSQPRLFRVKVNEDGTDKIKVVAFVAAGYDNNEDLRWGATQTFPPSTDDTTDINSISAGSGSVTSTNGANPYNPKGRGLYAFEIATLNAVDGKLVPTIATNPKPIWTYTQAQNSSMTFSFPTDLAVLDTTADGFADTIYAGDTGGRMWRFKLDGTNPSTQWTGNIIFNANGSGTDVGRKIFYRPSVTFDRVKVKEGDQVVYRIRPIVFFGTGDRSHPLNTAVTDRLYSVIDKGQTTADAIDSTDLLDVTDNELQLESTTPTDATNILNQLRDVDNYGWYIDLEGNGEKSLAGTVVFNNIALYTTYEPNNLDSPDPCNPNHLGTARVYGVNAQTGEAILNWHKGNDSEKDTTTNERALNRDGEVLRKADRVMTIGQGIPSGIVTLIDASGKVTLMISSSNRVTTIEGIDARLINPVYWMQW